MIALTVRSFALAICFPVAAALAADSPGPDPAAGYHVTRSGSGFVGGPDAHQRHDPATLEELALAPGDVVRQVKPLSGVKAAYFWDAWIHDASVELFDDFDRDGYYSRLRVRFDADTIHDRLHVYAVLLLSPDGVTWEVIHITDDFLIRGTSPHDDYVIEVELIAGYPTGLYDVLIELYDADRGRLLDEFGPAESSAFALLPLEDARRDGIATAVSVSHGSGGGGAVSRVMLMLLAGAALVASASAGPPCPGPVKAGNGARDRCVRAWRCRRAHRAVARLTVPSRTPNIDRGRHDI